PWPTNAALPVSGRTTLMSYVSAASPALETVTASTAAVISPAHDLRIGFIFLLADKASWSITARQETVNCPEPHGAKQDGGPGRGAIPSNKSLRYRKVRPRKGSFNGICYFPLWSHL